MTDIGRSLRDGLSSSTEPEVSALRASIPSAVPLACPDCGKHWRDVPLPEHDIDILDAFYSAIPEKFGSCIGGERHGTVAASIPLCDNDRMWLRGLAAAFDAFAKAETRREALTRMVQHDEALGLYDASAIETRQGGDVQQAPPQRDEGAVPNGETPKGRPEQPR